TRGMTANGPAGSSTTGSARRSRKPDRNRPGDWKLHDRSHAGAAMSIFPLQALDGLFHDYGYGAIFAGVLLESTGLPLPGESLMIAAALYAATTHHLNIFILVPLAAAGAICGDQIGYFIGRWIG